MRTILLTGITGDNGTDSVGTGTFAGLTRRRTIDFTVNTQRDRGTDHRVFDTMAHLTYGASGAPTTLTFDGNVTYDLNLKTGEVIKQ